MVLTIEYTKYEDCDEDDIFCKKKAVRSVIKNDDKILYPSHPWPTEGYLKTSGGVARVVTKNSVDISYKLPSIEQCKVYTSYEGTLIRVFWFDGIWRVSTNKKIDALESKWGGDESFFEIFQNNLKELGIIDAEKYFEENLKKNRLYMFYMRATKDTKIVCNPENNPNPVLLVDIIERDSKGFKSIDQTLEHIPRAVPIEAKTVKEAVLSIAKKSPFEAQGVIIMVRNSGSGMVDFIIKISTEKYAKLKSLRNNDPNKAKRYYEVRSGGNHEDIKLYKLMYPELDTFFRQEDKRLDVAVNSLERLYKTYFAPRAPLRKQAPELAQSTYEFLKRLDANKTLMGALLAQDTKLQLGIVNYMNDKTAIELVKKIPKFKTATGTTKGKPFKKLNIDYTLKMGYRQSSGGL